MKTKIVFILPTAGFLVLATWLLYEFNPAQAHEIPEKYHDTVRKGLEYLARNQCKDGHWEGEEGKHPAAMTGLAGLALLMEADTENVHGFGKLPLAGKYAANIRMAADWLMAKSPQGKGGRDGLIFSEHPTETARYMQGHGLATLFLAGVYKIEPDKERRKKLHDVLTRAVKYIVNAQSTQRGWYPTSRVEGHDLDDFSATVIQIQALQAAENAGIPVPGETISDAKVYLITALAKYEEGAKPALNRSRPADTAAALTCLFNLEWNINVRSSEKNDLSAKWFKYCQKEIAVGRAMQFGRDDLTHYYFAQAVFNLGGGDTWSDYRTAMFDHLQSSQNKDGSWPAPSSAGREGISVGPVHVTALWCTVLQLDKKNHPSQRRTPVAVR